MASIRQLAAKQINNQVGNPTLLLTGANQPVAGRHLAILLTGYYFVDAVLSISDDKSSPWARIAQRRVGNHTVAEIWLAAYSGTGDVTLTFDNANAPTNHYYTWRPLEIAGLISSPVDSGAAGSSSGTTSGVDANVTGAGDTETDDNVLLACFSCAQGNNGFGIVTPNGWTEQYKEENGSANICGAGASRIITSRETPSIAWSHDNTTEGWAAVVVALKAEPSASSGLPLLGNFNLRGDRARRA